MAIKRIIVAAAALSIVMAMSIGETYLSYIGFYPPRYRVDEAVYQMLGYGGSSASSILQSVATGMIWTLPEVLLGLVLYEIGLLLFVRERPGRGI